MGGWRHIAHAAQVAVSASNTPTAEK
jgi:hypothetical protein